MIDVPAQGDDQMEGRRARLPAGKYSREHSWSFDGGLTVPASSSPAVVRPPMSNPANIDPEEAYVASISSCHMLTFLHVARIAGFQIDSLRGRGGRRHGEERRRRRRGWRRSRSTRASRTAATSARRTKQETQLHHKAHDGCFIAQSIKTEVKVAGLSEPANWSRLNRQSRKEGVMRTQDSFSRRPTVPRPAAGSARRGMTAACGGDGDGGGPTDAFVGRWIKRRPSATDPRTGFTLDVHGPGCSPACNGPLR